MYLTSLEFNHDILRNIDPRCRLGAGIALTLPAIQSGSPLILGSLIFALCMCLVRDISVVVRRLMAVNVFTLFLWITLPLGALVTDLAGGASPGISGALSRALVYTLRINAAALLYMVTIIPLGIGGLANTLARLHCPAKLNALFLLTYRYIFIMYERIFVSLRSMAIRRPQQTTLGRWRSYAAVFGTALISAFLRAQKVGKALQVRGFTGRIPVTRSFAWKVRDTLFLAFSLLLALALWTLNGFFPEAYGTLKGG
jgi:energy-coupling factor transporter transmembrane protein EcfT